MKHIACCIPLSWEYIPRLFFLSWYNMQQYAVGRYHLSVVTNTTCSMDASRDSLAKEAMKHDPAGIFWLDADQVYPADTPERLMKHIDSGKLVVGGVTPHGGTGVPLIYDMVDPSGICTVRTTSLHQGIIKVGAMGLGGIMTSPEVFKIIKYPWFRMIWNTKEGSRPGVDLQFYGNCEKAGIDVWVDTDLVYGHVVVGLKELKESKPNIDRTKIIGDYTEDT